MTAMPRIDMTEVTRLTRAGRLHEATSLLRRGLAGPRADPPAATPRDAAGSDATSDAGFDSALDFARAPGGGWHWPDADTIEPRARPAGFATRVVRTAAGSLTYKLYVPASLPAGPVPLVVMLHGCTQDPDDFATGTRMNDHADRFGFLVAYPAQSQAANPSRCWNWFRSGDQRRDRGEPALVAALTREVLAERAVDPGRVFVAGLSAGGAAAAVMGCAYPDLYAGIGVHSGLACGAASDMPSAFAAMRGGADRAGRPSGTVRTIVFHGSADQTVSPGNARHVVDQVAAHAAPDAASRGTTPRGVGYRRTVWRDGGGHSVAEQWIVDGAGHAWFGGDPAGSFTDPRGPDASLEMLRFFGIAPGA